MIRYSDADQSVMFDTSAKFSITTLGNADSDNLVEPGELLELSLLNMETNLATQLVKNRTFTLEVLTQQGAVLHIERSVPAGVEKYNDLG